MSRLSWTRNLSLIVAIVGTLACRGSEQPAPEPPPTAAPLVAPKPAPKVRPTPAPPPKATPPPVSQPAATPKPAPRTIPTPVPPPTLDHARVSALVADGERALAQGKLAEAAELFGDALALDPDDARARRGKARVATTKLGLARTFVPDLASSEGVEGKVKKIEGFEDVEERDVRRAVKVPGRAELDGTPGHVKPGDTYTVNIYLRNQDIKKKRKIRIVNVNVRRNLNDKDSAVAVVWKPLELQPKERGLVATLSGPWEDDVSSWILSVKVLSDSGDIYENRLVWQ